MVNHGYTPGRPGCYAAADDRKHKPHTTACREKLAMVFIEDEKESHRITDARDREDAFIENTIREGDTHVDNNAASSPCEEIHTPVAQPITPELQVRSQRMPNAVNAPTSYEDMLNENMFHDVANQDQDMYDAIGAIPIDQDDMVNNIVATFQRHVSEVWSPPRMTASSPEYGLSPGSAYEIETNDELGQTWDFD